MRVLAADAVPGGLVCANEVGDVPPMLIFAYVGMPMSSGAQVVIFVIKEIMAKKGCFFMVNLILSINFGHASRRFEIKLAGRFW